MKINLLIFIALFTFAFSSCKDDTTTTTPTPTDTFPYDGNWTGDYIGDDQGTVTITIDNDGKLSGSAYSNNAMSTFALTGTVGTDGKLDATSASTGATFAGTLTPTSGTGTWTNNTIGGSWSATKK